MMSPKRAPRLPTLTEQWDSLERRVRLLEQEIAYLQRDSVTHEKSYLRQGIDILDARLRRVEAHNVLPWPERLRALLSFDRLPGWPLHEVKQPRRPDEKVKP
jgi:hypothetical protein